MVTMVPRPRSIRGRCTLAATLLSLVVLVAVGSSLDLAIRYKIHDGAFRDAERVAGQWSAAARNGGVPHLIPTSSRVDLVQVVDAHGRVVNSSLQARGRPPMSTTRPPANDRFRRLIGGRVMLMAIRISPAPDAPVVYAGLAEPPILRKHHLEYVIEAAALIFTGLMAWMTWCVVGRTFTRLEGAVEQQRQLASTTSHELRSPITGLRTQLEEALLYPDDVDPRDTIRGALSATGRLEAIIKDVLVAARPTPHELIDLATLVTQEAAQLRGVPVHVHAASDVRIHGSRIQLIRVLGNVLSNAQRHADTGIDVFVESTNGQAIVAVVDDGTGIGPADRERVFERFTRLSDGRRRDPGGSGLGLAISRDIAHSHQGTLRIEDSHRGARFVLRLPLPDTKTAPRNEPIPNEPIPNEPIPSEPTA
jgi:signal transduction histidine kinase